MAFAGHESGCSTMGFTENGDDPTARRRADPQTQRERDAEVARMRASGVPFRATAGAMGMSLAACRSRCAPPRPS